MLPVPLLLLLLLLITFFTGLEASFVGGVIAQLGTDVVAELHRAGSSRGDPQRRGAVRQTNSSRAERKGAAAKTERRQATDAESDRVRDTADRSAGDGHPRALQQRSRAWRLCARPSQPVGAVRV